MVDRFDILGHALCDTGHYLDARGHFAGTDGNISVRLPARCSRDADRVMITPSGVRKGRIEPSDLCVMSLDMTDPRGSNCRGRVPSSESKMHLAIYRGRSDVGAIIHAHSPYSVAWACSGLPVPEGLHPEAEVHLGTVPVVPYWMPGSVRVAAQVARTARSPDTTCLLMANHGAVAFGRTLDEAADRLDMLEAYLKMVVALRQIGAEDPLSARNLDDLRKWAKRGSQPQGADEADPED
ncbi:MAG: class II aldolase/adducin family protein [Planctomycetes bacterium]|nr:class II aldolase/adducin family protein [Planctomycetota bacterium]NOG55186.1 class II aldolase/adducin family protein [Planctomycetota bacterium]